MRTILLWKVMGVPHIVKIIQCFKHSAKSLIWNVYAVSNIGSFDHLFLKLKWLIVSRANLNIQETQKQINWAAQKNLTIVSTPTNWQGHIQRLAITAKGKQLPTLLQGAARRKDVKLYGAEKMRNSWMKIIKVTFESVYCGRWLRLFSRNNNNIFFQ